MKKFTLSALAGMAVVISSQSSWALSGATGFLINEEGHIITNNHVVMHDYVTKSGLRFEVTCRSISVSSRGVKRNSRAEIIARDEANDLAVIKISKDNLLRNDTPYASKNGNKTVSIHLTGSGWNNIGQLLSPGGGSISGLTGSTASSSVEFLKFTSKTANPGTKINLFGYARLFVSSPLKVFSGVIAANTGLWDNTSFLQYDAASNPGNSGGPVLNEAGHIVGVHSRKLRVMISRWRGIDVPQGFNFGVKSVLAKSFLDIHGIPYHTAKSNQKIDTREMYRRAQKSVVSILCFGH